MTAPRREVSLNIRIGVKPPQQKRTGRSLMDRVTEAFLSEFVGEHELSKLSPDKQFEHFAAHVCVRRHYNGETFDPEDIYTGGGGDTGIDAVAILVNGSLVTDVESLQEHAEISGHFDATFIFVQADRGSSFDGKKVSDF